MDPFLGSIWVVVAALIALLLPGFAWLVLFWDRDQDLFEQLAGVIGASIALTALTALGFFLFNWKFSTIWLVGLYAASAMVVSGAVVYRLLVQTHPAHSDQSSSVELQVESEGEDSISSRRMPSWIGTILLGVALSLIVALRFFQVQDLVLPAWVDSIHHVLIVQAFLEDRGIPETLAPYLPIPFYYHYAFHALSAVFSAVAKVSPHQSVLWIGQILNVAVALAVYRLGKALWGDWRRAGLGLLLIGFLSQMPAYYATWGRYTLLTGLVLLPLAMATAQDILNKGISRSRLATLALLESGLFLSHYYAALLFAVFLVFLLGQALIEDFATGQARIRDKWLPLFLAIGIGFLLAAPWLYRMWGYAQNEVSVGAVSLSLKAVEESYYPGYLSYLLHLLGPRRNIIFLIISLGGLPFAIRCRETRPFALWAIALGLFCLPWGIYLAPFRPDHAAIILFLPAALLLANLIGTVIEWLVTIRFSRITVPVVSLVVVALIAWGAWDTRQIINSSTVLAKPEDLRALSWIEGNTPEDARFLVNVTHWQYGTYRGVDGGWWIGPLTGRETLLPAVLYVMGDQNYVRQVNEYARQASELQGCSPEFWDLVRKAGITYIYLNGAKGSLKAENLQNCPNLVLVYQDGGVSIYRILNQGSADQDMWYKD